MHDEASVHFAHDVKQFLDTHYPHQWMEWNELVLWLPQFPNLTPADFCLWGHLKGLLKKCEHVGQALAFDSSDCDNSMMHAFSI
jgi:hypothetical protein